MNDPEPIAPQEPAPGACCESGCEFCVMDIYYSELNQWRVEHAAWKKRQDNKENHDAP